MSKIETEILESMLEVDTQTEALAKLDVEFHKYASETSRFRTRGRRPRDRSPRQLIELEEAIVDAEDIIPRDHRDQYRRVVKQRKDDAFAAVEDSSCAGCYVSVTPQMVNDLINVNGLVFCKTCGRILYLAEEVHSTTRRNGV